MSDLIQITQCHKAVDLHSVLLQSSVTGFDIPELTLYDAKTMLNLGPYQSMFFVSFLLT